ncbi:MAG TPA: DNA gyrase subunit A, partial [Spirochaetota bacterium]|nr:DNA gyrase subunit A [Spirochaetota bacterium]
IIKEMPYCTTTESLIESIDNASKKGKIKISSINDFTTEKVEIEIKVSRGENSTDVEKLLYAYTDCEVSVSLNCIVIKDGRPHECGVSDLLRYNTEKLVVDLKRELEIEKDKLTEKLNDLTLEMIFIENRIYKKIEEIAVYDEIISTVIKELNKHKKLFIRELKTEDVERLLEIKIRRISRFDIENHKKNMDDIVRRLDLVKERLKDVVKYAIEYIDNLIKKYGGAYRRKTKIRKIKTLSASEIVQPDVKVYWDKKTGFLGTDVKSDERFTASPIDKFLVISKDCSYKVVSIDSKTFIDTKVEYLAKYDDNVTFSLIYTDLESKISYAKKFKITKYLTNKVYNLAFCEKGRVDYLSVNPKDKVVIEYVKKPRQKINSEIFSFSEVEIKSSSAKGVRVSTKELKKVTKK